MEVTGLALAIFPIVVQGLQFYLGPGHQTIMDFRNYKRALKPLVRQLNMEGCKFENTCELLLEGTVSAEQVASLVKGVGWNQPEFQEVLHDHLHPNQAAAFVEAVEALHSKLHNLSEELGISEDNLPSEKESQKRQWKKVKLALKRSSYVATLEEIKAINADLAQLTMQRPPTNAVQKSGRQLRTAKNYNVRRSHAKALHNVFGNMFGEALCPCPTPHNASLRLEKPSFKQMDQEAVRLKVLFEFEHAPTREWRAIDFEPVAPVENMTESRIDDQNNAGQQLQMHCDDSSVRSTGSPAKKSWFKMPAFSIGVGDDSRQSIVKTPTARKKVAFRDQEEQQVRPRTPNVSTSSAFDTLKRIENLCSVIKETMTVGTHDCVGLLVDGCNGPWHRIWTPLTLSSYASLTGAISLDDVLSPQYLELKDRLELGILLASAVMQLHTTEWLNEDWGKGDIFFLQKITQRRTTRGNIEPVFEPVIDKPFVRRTFGSSQELHPIPQAPNSPASTLVVCERSLFSLGIVLIELWFEKRIEELSPDGDQDQDDGNARYKTARKLLGDIFTYAGENYGLAVSRCINGLTPSGGSAPATWGSLDNEDFKNDVHTNVVALLEKNFESFKSAYR